MDEQAHADEPGMIRRLGPFWTVANGLSLARALLVIPITDLILVDGPLRWIMLLISLAGMTDWFDGRVARWSGTVSSSAANSASWT